MLANLARLAQPIDLLIEYQPSAGTRQRQSRESRSRIAGIGELHSVRRGIIQQPVAVERDAVGGAQKAARSCFSGAGRDGGIGDCLECLPRGWERTALRQRLLQSQQQLLTTASA